MKLSLNWLKDFVTTPKRVTPEALGEKLMLTTVEIEGIEKRGAWLDKIIVGEVLEVKKHPNADRLSLTKVNIGGGKILNIVCGAPNVAVGQKVTVAMPGTVLANGVRLEKREVRGIVSEGMICAEDELGLGSMHVGIMVLPPKTKVGHKLTDVLPVKDIIYEVDNKTLSNRPDLWGHYGIAREIAAFLGQKLKEHKVRKIKTQAKPSKKLEIKVQDKKLCPRYLGVVVDGIKIAPSPEWLRWRLESVEVRAINNIVDITNHIMLELGQPLHAFDFEKIESVKIRNPKSEIRNKSKIQNFKQIIVRTAKSGESIATIDGAQRKLDLSMLVIADSKKPIAIAGVMGGANTEVDDKTTTIILESANFDPVSVRKTSMRLGLRTDASMRFEKGLDPNLAEMAMNKALNMIMDLSPDAKVASKIMDIKNFKLNQGPIKLSLDYLNKKIGQEIPAAKVVSILKSLGFGLKKIGKVLNVKIPTWRATGDVKIADDLVEEVARVYGYDNIHGKMPEVVMAAPEENRARKVERMVKNILTDGLEMIEVHNYSFVDEKNLRKMEFDPTKHVRLINPIAKNLSHLRQSLIPNLILNISQNQHFFEKVKIFELGTIFYPERGEYYKDASQKEFLPQQDKSLAGMFLERGNDTPFYEAKDAAITLLNALNIDYKFTVWRDNAPKWAHSARTAQINSGGKTLGLVTELNSKIQNSFGIKHKVGIFGINFDELAKLYSDKKLYRPIPKYPSIELDVAVIVPKKTVWQEMLKNIFEVDRRLICEVRLFDVYEGRGVETGKKSLAFRVVYRSDERTLKLDEAKRIEQQIIQKLAQKFGAKLRS
jgi:phenylalanyl-tRNA synthetase beta chain